MTDPRQRLVSADEPGFYHCVSRCVRRAFLCGFDHYTGQCFEHRKIWIERRMFELSAVFAISLYGYAVMSNHLHIIVYVDPATPLRWSDREIAERWCQLFPRKGGERAQAARVDALMQDPLRLTELRKRLGSLSWFMRCLNEPIARRANAEDGCSGRFWQGRFRSQALLGERAVLAALAYVDLNPIRAGIADRLRQSRHTSIFRRVKVLAGQPESVGLPLAPLAGALREPPPVGLTTGEYVELVRSTRDRVGPKRVRARTTIAAGVLTRMRLTEANWVRQVRAVGCPYYRALGTFVQLRDKALQIGQHWLKGVAIARELERA